MSGQRCLVCLSGPDLATLRRRASQLASERLDIRPRAPARPARRGPARLVVRGETPAAVASQLATFASAGAAQDATLGLPGPPPRVAFLFSGQGDVHAGMGAGLVTRSPAFRSVLDAGDPILSRELAVQTRELLARDDERGRLGDARFAQPALYALQCALVALWRELGVEPAAVTGHSLGEYAAAQAAGSMNFEDGLALVVERGRLTSERAQPGCMAAVFADAKTVDSTLRDEQNVVLAAVNAPELVAISGPEAGVGRVRGVLEARGIATAALGTTHPFHSPGVDPILAPLERAAAATRLGIPGLPFASTLEGRLLAWDEAPGATYWRRHAREPVRFLTAVRALDRIGCTHFVEIGPHVTLTRLGAQCVRGSARWLPSLTRRRPDEEVLLACATALWLDGVDVDISRAAGAMGWRCLADEDAD